MPKDVKHIEYLTEDKLEEIALSVHEPINDSTFPFDVEGYLYIKYKYRIQPSPRLEAGCNIDTALVACLNLIRIDERIYEKQYFRARFSMAHELGHLILHKDVIDNIVALLKEAQKTDQYRSIISFLSDRPYRRAEWQAQYFAGCLLAPRKILKSKLEELIQERKLHTDNQNLDGEDRSIIYHDLSRYFEVTRECIVTRISVTSLDYLFYLDDPEIK